jgi:hypothetical protein
MSGNGGKLKDANNVVVEEARAEALPFLPLEGARIRAKQGGGPAQQMEGRKSRCG